MGVAGDLYIKCQVNKQNRDEGTPASGYSVQALIPGSDID